MTTLRASFEQAIVFLSSQADVLAVDQETIENYAQTEASVGPVKVGSSGATQGMSSHLLSPAHSFLAQWKEARSPFDSQIQPYLHNIQALEDAQKEAEQLRKSMAGLTSQIKEKAAEILEYSEAEKKLEETKRQYERMKSNEGAREANLGSYSLFYWPALFLIGVAEWLINYDTFLTFLAVPAFAVGVTIVLGVLLAFAAHSHGAIFKQWSYIFGAHRKDIDRHGEWRYFSLSTFALLLVLLAAGGSRYESVMRDANINVSGSVSSSVGSSMGSSMEGDTTVSSDKSGGGDKTNLLGEEADTHSNPVRDVMLSLLANLAAWAVGVFLSYLLHDRNPGYMQSAHDFKKAHKRFSSLHKKYVENEIVRQDAIIGRRIEELLASAADRSERVREQLDMWMALNKREAEIKSTVTKIVENNLCAYRNALMQVSGVKFVMSGRTISTEDFAIIPLSFE